MGQHGRVTATADLDADLRALADEYWEAKLEASPLFATFLGDHRYDDRVDDLSAQAEVALADTDPEGGETADGTDIDNYDALEIGLGTSIKF